MTTSGATWSCVSLGLSCQTAHQLRKQISGEDAIDSGSKVNGAYFDYIITPFNHLMQALESEFPVLKSAEEMDVHLGQPRWVNEGVYCPHSFREHGSWGEVQIESTFQDCSAKLAYLRLKFLSLEKHQQDLLFFMGNAQPELFYYSEEPERFPELFGFSEAKIARCVAALRGRFGARFKKLVLVEGEHTRSGVWSCDDVIRYDSGSLYGDPAPWEGDDDFWRTIIETELRSNGLMPSLAMTSYP